MDADRQVEQYARARAFLCTVSACEGTDGDEGYRALFGYRIIPGRTFTGFDDHPRQKFPFRQTDGTTEYTSASGKYQEIIKTFDRLQAKLGTKGFSPDVQERHAMELVSEAGALPAIQRGDFQAAIDLCAGVWASLPASKYPQPKRTYAFALNAYLSAGGTLA